MSSVRCDQSTACRPARCVWVQRRPGSAGRTAGACMGAPSHQGAPNPPVQLLSPPVRRWGPGPAAPWRPSAVELEHAVVAERAACGESRFCGWGCSTHARCRHPLAVVTVSGYGMGSHSLSAWLCAMSLVTHLRPGHPGTSVFFFWLQRRTAPTRQSVRGAAVHCRPRT